MGSDIANYIFDEVKAYRARLARGARLVLKVDLAAYTIGCAVLSRDILIDQHGYNEKWRAYYKLPEEERIKWFSKTNLDEAKYWLKKVVHGECEHKILGEADMFDAQEKLKEIEEEHEKSNGE